MNRALYLETVIADETGNEASVSANASIEFGRSRMGRSGRR